MMSESWKNKKILITGGAGFIGSHTCDFLLEQGAKVLVVDNLCSGFKKNLQSASASSLFSFTELDITETAIFSEEVKTFQPDAIIHLAALVSVPLSIAEPELNFRQNIVATQSVIEAARLANVPKIVFASSSAIYGETKTTPIYENTPPQPLSPYGAAKIACEYLLYGAAQAYGISVTAQRYFNIFGPRQDPSSPYSGVISIFLDRFRKGHEVTIYGDGEQTRDFVFVKDVARANALACLSTEQLFCAHNIATSKTITLNELAAVFLEHFPNGKKPKHLEARHGDIVHSSGQNQAAQKNIGFTPEYSFTEGLKILVSEAE